MCFNEKDNAKIAQNNEQIDSQMDTEKCPSAPSQEPGIGRQLLGVAAVGAGIFLGFGAAIGVGTALTGAIGSLLGTGLLPTIAIVGGAATLLCLLGHKAMTNSWMPEIPLQPGVLHG